MLFHTDDETAAKLVSLRCDLSVNADPSTLPSSVIRHAPSTPSFNTDFNTSGRRRAANMRAAQSRKKMLERVGHDFEVASVFFAARGFGLRGTVITSSSRRCGVWCGWCPGVNANVVTTTTATAMSLLARHRYMVQRVADAFGYADEDQVEQMMLVADVLQAIDFFFTAAGPRKIIVTIVDEEEKEKAKAVHHKKRAHAAAAQQKEAKKVMKIFFSDVEVLPRIAVYFMKARRHAEDNAPREYFFRSACCSIKMHVASSHKNKGAC